MLKARRETRRKAAQLLAALRPFPNVKVKQLEALLCVAMEPGLSVTDLAKRAGTTTSTMSHVLVSLSGHGLIEATSALDEGVRWQEGGNRKAHFLTDKGKTLLEKEPHQGGDSAYVLSRRQVLP